MKHYTVNEVFYSLQGEGVRAGTANVFVRFSGCNMRCAMEAGEKSPGGFDCDTEFTSGRKMTAQELRVLCDEIRLDCKAVIFTGGEPALQIDDELLDAFGDWHKAIETNGSLAVPCATRFDWITVSPKVAEHCIKQLEAHEVKYVRGYGQGLPRTVINAQHKLISPAFESHDMNAKTVQWCIDLVKQNPDWRLSVQLHNIWRVR